MPKKKDDSRSYGQKLIRAFAKLLFSKERHSHPELARLLDCSKATVGRLIRDIREAYGVEYLHHMGVNTIRMSRYIEV